PPPGRPTRGCLRRPVVAVVVVAAAAAASGTQITPSLRRTAVTIAPPKRPVDVRPARYGRWGTVSRGEDDHAQARRSGGSRLGRGDHERLLSAERRRTDRPGARCRRGGGRGSVGSGDQRGAGAG